MPDTKPTALILLNMGGPDSLEAVEPFLYNLFCDRELIQLPAGALLQKPFAKLISYFRAKKVVENYRAIGGKSPLLEWTQKQAAGIAQRLGEHFEPYVIMRYWNPRAEDVLAEIKAAGIETAVVVSMYPHYTGATTGSSVNDFKRATAKVFPELEYQLIEEWFDWPGYLDALANRINAGLDTFHDLMRDDVQILFSAHALPQKFIDRGDPYQQHVEITVQEVMQRVGHYDWSIAYQSRSGPVKWMTPGTDEMISELASAGHRALLMVPVSFVSDHIETLEEIDIEYRDLATTQGIVNFCRAPSLNDNDDFLSAMAALVRERYRL
ncbi:MAG: ferrochelatase [Deltaproteobacteria bacterium]|nr:ferrochelatase [Deltaproteobacteria bacterium]MCW8892818.1 ferrochelatase [Deltaproteobacteria bacterium]MCW9049186.1 ferrochelatase [Deltaproteobacteria bacterium]